MRMLLEMLAELEFNTSQKGLFITRLWMYICSYSSLHFLQSLYSYCDRVNTTGIFDKNQLKCNDSAS